MRRKRGVYRNWRERKQRDGERRLERKDRGMGRGREKKKKKVGRWRDRNKEVNRRRMEQRGGQEKK